jgi:hypothetical protein
MYSLHQSPIRKGDFRLGGGFSADIGLSQTGQELKLLVAIPVDTRAFDRLALAIKKTE